MIGGSILLENPGVLTALTGDIPGAAWLGLQEFVQTFKARTSRATPIGWKYKKGAKNKKGTIKRGTQKWVRSGKLRKSWDIEEQQGERAVTLFTDLPYAHVLELGLYPNPPQGKPRTNVPWTPWRVAGGFSKQAPSGIVGPLLNDERLQRNAMNLIVQEISKMFQRAVGG